MMTLNIKDPEAHQLAKQLARRTGESMTRAVTEAIRERLDRVSRLPQSQATADDLLAIGRRCAAALKAKPVDHGTLLYDAKGLPR
jgi:antitoxin VapB